MKIHPVLHVGRFARVIVAWWLGRPCAIHAVDAHDGLRVDCWAYRSNGRVSKWTLPHFD
jgi:hypothetical protein